MQTLARVLARVAIFGTSESSEHTVTVVVSNYNYGMAVSPSHQVRTPVRWKSYFLLAEGLSTYLD